MSAISYDGLPASYFLAFQKCPNCNDEVFAATGATLTSDGMVRFEWCCDLCGHKFETAEKNDVRVLDQHKNRSEPEILPSTN
jgi:transcriptional regulator NrdR family protein